MNDLISKSSLLPCRDNEFQEIYEFVYENLYNQTGGCLYISGLPGTGKTETVQSVLGAIQRDLQGNSVDDTDMKMNVVQVNGMHVTDPRQVFTLIYQQMNGRSVSIKKAAEWLESVFCAPSHRSAKRQATSFDGSLVLVIDELDLLCTRGRQSVLYSLFDWPTRPRGRKALIVICIANTMDLPERMLHPRVASRLGLNRLTFAPYSREQLLEIVQSKVLKSGIKYESTAIELALRKVAAVSGDARRALSICKRAVELAKSSKSPITMKLIDTVLSEMFATPKVKAIRHATSLYEKFFLRALLSELKSRHAEEAELGRIMDSMVKICQIEGKEKPTESEVFAICGALGAHKILLTEPCVRDIHMAVRLNCAASDVDYALSKK